VEGVRERLIPLVEYLVHLGHTPIYHREGLGFGASSSGTPAPACPLHNGGGVGEP
jgi:hypothetical protein